METEKQGEKKIREVRKTNKQAKNVRKRRGTQHRGIREGGREPEDELQSGRETRAFEDHRQSGQVLHLFLMGRAV